MSLLHWPLTHTQCCKVTKYKYFVTVLQPHSLCLALRFRHVQTSHVKSQDRLRAEPPNHFSLKHLKTAWPAHLSARPWLLTKIPMILLPRRQPVSAASILGEDEHSPWPYLAKMFAFVGIKDSSYSVSCVCRRIWNYWRFKILHRIWKNTLR